MQKILRYLLPTTLVLMLLVAYATPAFAAFNDTSYTDDATIYLSGSNQTITVVSGTTVESIVVESSSASSFTVTLLAGSTATFHSTARTLLVNDGGTGDPVSTTCASGYSELVLSGNLGAVIVTPNGTCPSGGGGGGGGGTPTPPAEPTTPTTPVTTTGQVTATSGGGGQTTITASDSVTASVVLPANAVSADTVVNIATETSASVVAAKPAPAGKSVVGADVYNYTASQGSTAVSSFASDLTFTFTYTDAQVEGLNINSLKVYYYDDTAEAWTVLSSTVDTVAKTVTATANHFTYFALFGDPETVTVDIVDSDGTALVDGDLISTQDSFDIYIATLVGAKKFKRLILNPTIFESYGHLDWGNVKTVSQEVQDQFTLSDLVIEVNADGTVYDEKVYKVSSDPDSDVGQKQWLNMTAAQFEAEGYDWDALAKINHTEAGVDFYPEGTAITSSL